MAEQKRNFNFGITVLAGARYTHFKQLSKEYGVEKKYKTKWRTSLIVSLISSFFSIFDQYFFSKKTLPIKIKDPIFILGHWRSGTTFLHNLMCLDPQMSFTTTYQSIFPNNLFFFQNLFKFFMKILMPKKRPVDNVLLNADYPQEEEFALTNAYGKSFYNWWYFPKSIRKIAEKQLLGKNLTFEENELWKVNFKHYVSRTMAHSKTNRYISKNPPHTARIPQLLALYPNAKFIYIHRNPYEVIQSTFAFYKSILPGIQLQDINDKTLLDAIIWVYKNLIHKYEIDKNEIPKGNLLEVTYKNLIEDPKTVIQTIYEQLLKEDFTHIQSKTHDFIKEKKAHVLKKYLFEPDYLSLVNSELSDIIKLKGYEVLNG